MFDFIKILFKGKEAVMKERHEKALSMIESGGREAGMKALLELAGREYAPAEYSLGEFSRTELNDQAAAFDWYARAAEMAFAGTGRPVDQAEALEWYQAAARAGVVGALYAVAEFYRTGRFLPKDRRMAEDYYNFAARAGHEEAQKRLDEFWPHGEYLESEDDPPPEFIELKPLWLELIGEASRRGAVPGGRLTVNSELLAYEHALLFNVSLEFKEERAAPIAYDRLRKLFDLVFIKAYDAAFAWRMDPFILCTRRDDRLHFRWYDDEDLRMPDAAEQEVRQCAVPRAMLDLMLGWCGKNGASASAAGMALSPPLELSLKAAFRSAVTMCLTSFGADCEAVAQARSEAAAVEYIEKQEFDPPAAPDAADEYTTETSLRTEKTGGRRRGNMVVYVKRRVSKKRSDPNYRYFIDYYSVSVSADMPFEEASKISLSFNRDFHEAAKHFHQDYNRGYYWHRTFSDGSCVKYEAIW